MTLKKNCTILLLTLLTPTIATSAIKTIFDPSTGIRVNAELSAPTTYELSVISLGAGATNPVANLNPNFVGVDFDYYTDYGAFAQYDFYRQWHPEARWTIDCGQLSVSSSIADNSSSIRTELEPSFPDVPVFSSTTLIWPDLSDNTWKTWVPTGSNTTSRHSRISMNIIFKPNLIASINGISRCPAGEWPIGLITDMEVIAGVRDKMAQRHVMTVRRKYVGTIKILTPLTVTATPSSIGGTLRPSPDPQRVFPGITVLVPNKQRTY